MFCRRIVRRSIRAAASLALLAVVMPVYAAQGHTDGFTLEEVMGAPYPSSLVAAPTGRSVAWVFDRQGVRNVWTADGSGTPGARQLTSFARDEGVDISELAWSADAQWIAFTRAGDLEDELPANVGNLPSGPTPQEVWIVAARGGTARQVANGHHPLFSADGSQLLWLEQGRLLSAPVRGGEAKPLIVDLGKISDVIRGAGGEKLAFVSNRSQHSIVGVYDVRRQSIVWMSPSLDQDSYPAFSPDASQIAFIRQPSDKTAPFISHREGQPWSIWVADVATGKGRPVWVAAAGTGSVFNPTLSDANLLWTARQQLVFPWERNGWLQLYAIPVHAGTPRPITAGSFEVMHMALSQDRQRLVFSSTQGETDRLHVWSVDPDGGTPMALSTGPTIEDDPQPAAEGALTFALQSDATHPLQPVVARSHGWQKLAPDSVPASFPSARLVTPQALSFPAADGEPSHGQLFLPQEVGRAKTHPAILFFHGGPRRQMMLGFHPMDAYNWMYAENQYLASRGYIVLSVNYRGGIGYGLNYREADDFGPGGGSELNDLLGAVSFLKSRPQVDGSRLGIWGGSYGGLMTALGLARASDSLAAGVDYAGVHNWVSFLAAMGVPPDSPQAARKAFDSSALSTVDRWKSPVLIVQADDDRSVPSSQASELITALRQHHVDYETLIIPNEIHDLILHASWLTLFNAQNEYFGRKLNNAPR